MSISGVYSNLGTRVKSELSHKLEIHINDKIINNGNSKRSFERSRVFKGPCTGIIKFDW